LADNDQLVKNADSAEYEKIIWWDFVAEKKNRSPAYKNLLAKGITLCCFQGKMG